MKPNLANQPEFLHHGYNGKGIILTHDVENSRIEYEKVKEIEGMTIIFPYTEAEWGQKH